MAQAAATQSPDALSEAPRAAFLRVADPLPRRGAGHFAIDLKLAVPILRLALPVVLGMLTQTAINILDTVMVGRLPKEIANPGQAAIGLSLPLMWLVGGFLSALWVGTQAITSRRAGEGRDDLAGRALTNSLVIGVGSGLMFSLVAIVVAPELVGRLYADPAVVEIGTRYLQLRLVGVLAMVTTFSYKSFFDGIGETHVFMSAAVVMNVMNLVLNFLLIYGNDALGVPAMHVTGAALASVISAYIGLAILIAWSFRPKLLKRFHYYTPRKLNLKVMREIARLSIPNGLATVVVMIGFEAFYWVVGQVNARTALAGNPVIATANQVIITLLMLTFMSSLAFGTATAALVSQSLGARRPYLAERYAWEAVKIWAYVVWAYGLVMMLFPEGLLSLATTDPEVVAVGRLPLQLLGLIQGVVAVAAIFAQTLYGVGNAKFVMYVEMVLHFFVMAPVAYLLGLVLDLGLIGVYGGPALYVVLLAAATYLKFRRGDWKEILI